MGYEGLFDGRRGKGEFATDTRGDGGGGIEVVSGRVFRSQRESFSREAGGEALDLLGHK